MCDKPIPDLDIVLIGAEEWDQDDEDDFDDGYDEDEDEGADDGEG